MAKIPDLSGMDLIQSDFIRTELRIGLTFSSLALRAESAEKASRNRANAQKAYDTALHHLRKTSLAESSTEEIERLLSTLKANLDFLKFADPAPSEGSHETGDPKSRF